MSKAGRLSYAGVAAPISFRPEIPHDTDKVAEVINQTKDERFHDSQPLSAISKKMQTFQERAEGKEKRQNTSVWRSGSTDSGAQQEQRVAAPGHMQRVAE